MLRRCLVITPAKNEEENLPDLISSMVGQVFRPAFWVIIDDGSRDRTLAIANEAAKRHSWIEVVYLEKGHRDLGIHLAEVMRHGFHYGITRCKEQGIEYGLLSIVDADMRLPSDYFQFMAQKFIEDPSLGVASGGIKYIEDGKIVEIRGRRDEPGGGNMVIRREFFEDIGGIPLSLSWDSVIKAKAQIKGWSTLRSEEIKALQARPTSSAQGYWQGYLHRGRCAHYLNLHPVHVAFKSVVLIRRRPRYVGLPFALGYLLEMITRGQKIDDEEVRRHFWNKYKSILRREVLL